MDFDKLVGRQKMRKKELGIQKEGEIKSERKKGERETMRQRESELPSSK